MRASLVLLLLACAAACNRPEPQDTQAMVRKSLHGVLVYPRSTVVDAAAGSNAAQLTLTSIDSVGTVAGWFRSELSLNGWSLESDVTNGDGSVTIQAQKGKRPLWVTLRPNVGGPGSTYSVIGAIVSGDSLTVADSGAAKPATR